MVFNYFPFRHVTDMVTDKVSDIYIGITATLPPLLPPKRNLHRHLHRQNRIYLKRSQSNYRIANFPKITPKGREQEDLKRKGDYTLLYIGIHRERWRDCKSIGTPNGAHAISNHKNHRISIT